MGLMQLDGKLAGNDTIPVFASVFQCPDVELLPTQCNYHKSSANVSLIGMFSRRLLPNLYIFQDAFGDNDNHLYTSTLRS